MKNYNMMKAIYNITLLMSTCKLVFRLWTIPLISENENSLCQPKFFKPFSLQMPLERQV